VSDNNVNLCTTIARSQTDRQARRPPLLDQTATDKDGTRNKFISQIYIPANVFAI